MKKYLPLILIVGAAGVAYYFMRKTPAQKAAEDATHGTAAASANAVSNILDSIKGALGKVTTSVPGQDNTGAYIDAASKAAKALPDAIKGLGDILSGWGSSSSNSGVSDPFYDYSYSGTWA